MGLNKSLSSLNFAHENLLSNIGTNEDASVFRIDDKIAIVQTVDFITPVVDDPFIYGQIAAANSLSDVFAMGANVLNALNIVGFDSCNLESEILPEILRGGADKVKECGGILVGGHTIETQQMYYGLSVTGTVSPDKFWSNNTAKIGDVLILTKPLGTGILSTAIKADLLNFAQIKEAVEVMRQLNFYAIKALEEIRVNAATDVTGFGFLGHLTEMLNQSISFEIYEKNISILRSAKQFADMGIIPEGSYKNREFAKKFVNKSDVDIVFYDAQTSGGLLLAICESDAQKALNRLKNAGYESCAIVGQAIQKDKDDIIFL